MTAPNLDEIRSAEGAFHHGLRGRWNAWFFGAVDRYVNRLTRQVKQDFTGLADGTVVELGPSVGPTWPTCPWAPG